MRARPRTLRLRIALLYGALTGVAVALVTIAAFLMHRRAQLQGVDSLLRRSAEHVAAELSAARSPQETAEVLSSSAILGADARVFDSQGAVVGQSRTGMSAPAFTLCEVFAGTDGNCSAGPVQGLPATWRTAGYQLLHDAEGKRWRVYAVSLDNGSRYLAAMLPLAETERSLVTFARWLIMVTLTTVTGSTLIGWRMARRALRPVAILTAGVMTQSRASSRRTSDESDRDELDWLAATFNEMLATLQTANETQKRFIAAASHELRAPLTIISANLEFLSDERRMPAADRVQAIEEAHTQARRMGRLISNLLVLARVDAGIPLVRQAVELDRVLLEVVGELRHVAKGQRLEIAKFEPILVQGDADRLKQLMLILLDNAVKYTPADQRVTVELTQEASSALLSIRDTGVGMAAPDLLRAFDRFFRADDARAMDAGGTGLGLSIARLIAEEHGGTDDLTSQGGHGTTAAVRIPTSGGMK